MPRDAPPNPRASLLDISGQAPSGGVYSGEFAPRYPPLTRALLLPLSMMKLVAMKIIVPLIRLLTFVAALYFSPVLHAQSINVLWYTYADERSEYRKKISGLAEIIDSHPRSNGVAWKLQFWEAGQPAPDFTRFDVLVIESGEAFLTGPSNNQNAVPDYRGILDNKAAIEAARGDRTFITGSDSDFHAIRGDTGNIPANPALGSGKCVPTSTSPDCWDGALGHLVNAVNWAGAGNKLGIVSLLDGEHPGSFWWTHEKSFLLNELHGRVSYAGSEQKPIINPSQADHPLNSGLTSKGLSDWNNSFHAFFLPVDGYEAIVDSSQRPGSAVAIATAVLAPIQRGAYGPEAEWECATDSIESLVWIWCEEAP